MNIFRQLRKGFTLIELLIVIVIIGILAVGLVPKVIDAPKKARDTTRKTDLNQIKVALESYYADHQDYPTPVADGRTPPEIGTYFQGGKIPQDPITVSPYFYHHETTGGHNCYIIAAHMDSPNGGNIDTVSIAATTCSVASSAKQGDGPFYAMSGGTF